MSMSTESKRSSSLYVPRFTPADYGSFFLAGQIPYPFPKLLERSDLLPQEHYVLRALMQYWQKSQSVLTSS
jgi:hypothetical protein